MTLIIIIHVFACVILMTLVLIQRGRGSGLVESFAGVESMFGTKTNTFLTRTTTIMSIVFFITCLSLAVLSIRQSKSLMVNLDTKKQKPVVKTEAPKVPTAPAAAVKTESPKTESVAVTPVKAEPAKAQAPQVEPVKTDSVKPVVPAAPEKAKTEAGKAG